MIKKLILTLILITSIINLNGSSLRVEINDISKNINKYKIIDVRDHDLFSQGHIKGAINFPINLTYEHKSINGKITEPSKMQKLLRDRGLDINDNIIIYDDGTFFDASRLFWALEVYDFKHIKLLNGGYKQWHTLLLPVSNKELKQKQSNYIASINNKRLATKFTTQIATKNPFQTIIDARDYQSYIGKKSSAKRYGHIPKAIHIPATHNITTSHNMPQLKTISELKKTYRDIKKDKKIVIYCALGRVSTTNYFAMRELGYDVANYDASWNEWGNDFNLPLENLSKGK